MMRMAILWLAVFAHFACTQSQSHESDDGPTNAQEDAAPVVRQSGSLDTATFAGGCFWCTEVQFQQLAGVDTVISGFIGGTVTNPTYKQVTTGRTGHAEAINVIYRPDVISYDQLLEAFFTSHDPTQLNRQGNDIGTQYRSAIFYHNDKEREKAAYYIKRLNEEGAYSNPIVTTLEPYTTFYIAEDYHQNYYNLNPEQAYCRYVIAPKLEKFKKVFKERLK